MSKKEEKLTGWDSLILITMAGVLITGTMAFTANLPWYWPVGYFVALIIAVKTSIKHDEKKAESVGE